MTDGTIGVTGKETTTLNQKFFRGGKKEAGHQETRVATPERIKDTKMTGMQERELKPRVWHR